MRWPLCDRGARSPPRFDPPQCSGPRLGARSYSHAPRAPRAELVAARQCQGRSAREGRRAAEYVAERVRQRRFRRDRGGGGGGGGGAREERARGGAPCAVEDAEHGDRPRLVARKARKKDRADEAGQQPRFALEARVRGRHGGGGGGGGVESDAPAFELEHERACGREHCREDREDDEEEAWARRAKKSRQTRGKCCRLGCHSSGGGGSGEKEEEEEKAVGDGPGGARGT